MTRILGLSGSLRAESTNTALLRVAADVAPDGTLVEVAVPNDIPLFNGDEERPHRPAVVEALRDRVAAADALLIASPEYNFSVSGVLKNTIDWLSRGGPSSPLHHKPAALMSSSGGSAGTHALRHLRQVLSHNRVRVLAGREVRVRRATSARAVVEDQAIRSDVAATIDALIALSHEPPHETDRPGSVFVIAPGVVVAEHLADALSEKGVRTLTAVTRSDAGRLLESRSIAAVVIHPDQGTEERELIEKDVRASTVDAPIVQPASTASAVREVLDAIGAGPAVPSRTIIT